MNLISEIEKSLPLYAYPTNHLLKSVDKKLILRLTSRLEITSVMDSGSAGGIMCGISLNNQVLLVSLTHLNFKEAHPLKEKISNYKTERINLLKVEEVTSKISIGRNKLCLCGSNKKYKKCCGG